MSKRTPHTKPGWHPARLIERRTAGGWVRIKARDVRPGDVICFDGERANLFRIEEPSFVVRSGWLKTWQAVATRIEGDK